MGKSYWRCEVLFLWVTWLIFWVIHALIASSFLLFFPFLFCSVWSNIWILFENYTFLLLWKFWFFDVDSLILCLNSAIVFSILIGTLSFTESVIESKWISPVFPWFQFYKLPWNIFLFCFEIWSLGEIKFAYLDVCILVDCLRPFLNRKLYKLSLPCCTLFKYLTEWKF